MRLHPRPPPPKIEGVCIGGGRPVFLVRETVQAATSLQVSRFGETDMRDQRRILKQLKMGTTEILVLAALTRGDRYGYEISREVFEQSEGFFEFKQGFLYPTLRRMEESGLVQSYWKDSVAGGPDRKYYHLTRRGRSRLKTSEAAWTEFSHRFNHMLAAAKR